MADNVRHQLTLFLDGAEAEAIEAIRSQYNPLQRQLIDCHLTLCREEELGGMEQVLRNLEHLRAEALVLELAAPVRFHEGRGVLLPVRSGGQAFRQLRGQVLKGTCEEPRPHEPHITLMHPRNSTCSDESFREILQHPIPSRVSCGSIAWIEQVHQGPWKVLRRFALAVSER